MKASKFIDSIERAFDVAMADQDDRVQVLGHEKLPRHIAQAVAAHRAELLRYLRTKQDVSLSPLRARNELRRLGFGQVPELGGIWVHPDGDDVGDAIVAGLLDPDAVREDVEDRNVRLRRMALGLGYRPTTPGSRIWKET